MIHGDRGEAGILALQTASAKQDEYDANEVTALHGARLIMHDA